MCDLGGKRNNKKVAREATLKSNSMEHCPQMTLSYYRGCGGTWETKSTTVSVMPHTYLLSNESIEMLWRNFIAP